MKYAGVKEFINDLIDNEGDTFADRYGRFWKYQRFHFMYKDLGDSEWRDGVFCLHLFGAGIVNTTKGNPHE